MSGHASSVNDSIVIRKVTIGDIMNLTNKYCNMPPHIKKLFHPFPFKRSRLVPIFLVMWLNGYILPIVKKVFPTLGANLVIAYDTTHSCIAGFAFFVINKKVGKKLVANAGPVIFEEFQGRRIGRTMYEFLIKSARRAGISRFHITIIEANIPSLKFHESLGFIVKGYTKDECWDGEMHKNMELELDLDKS